MITALRKNSGFKWIAALLFVCFAAFGFHFLLHLEHVDEDLHECPVCQAVAAFTGLIVFFFFLQVRFGSKRIPENTADFLYQNPCFVSISGRAPPVFS